MRRWPSTLMLPTRRCRGMSSMMSCRRKGSSGLGVTACTSSAALGHQAPPATHTGTHAGALNSGTSAHLAALGDGDGVERALQL